MATHVWAEQQEGETPRRSDSCLQTHEVTDWAPLTFLLAADHWSSSPILFAQRL